MMSSRGTPDSMGLKAMNFGVISSSDFELRLVDVTVSNKGSILGSLDKIVAAVVNVGRTTFGGFDEKLRGPCVVVSSWSGIILRGLFVL